MSIQALGSYVTPIEISFPVGTEFIDLPSGAPISGPEYRLTVEQLDDEGVDLIQSLVYYEGNLGFTWARRINKRGLEPLIGEWGPKNRFKPDQVVVANLTPSYRWKGTRDSVAMRTLDEDGLYTIINPTDLPSGASDTKGYLDVSNINYSSVVVQTWRTQNYPNEIYTRQIPDVNNPNKDWIKLGGAAPTGFFSGKTILFLSDGISSDMSYQVHVKNRLQLSNAISITLPEVQVSSSSDTSIDPFNLSNLSLNMATGTVDDLLSLASSHPTQSEAYVLAINRLAAVDLTTVDYMVVQVGNYDIINNVAAGTISDNSNLTYAGSINLMLGNLLDVYPHLNILILTPLKLDTLTDTTYVEYKDVCKDICGSLGVPVLDMYTEGGFNQYTLSEYVLDSKLTSAGSIHLANKISSRLESVF